MKKATIKTVKSNNRALILGALMSGALSRAELAKKTGLSKGAVTLLVNEFIEDGVLEDIGLMNFNAGVVGRPAIKVDIVPDYRYAAGFSLHRKNLAVCLVDLKNREIDSFSYKTEEFSSAKEAIDSLYEKLLEILKKHNIPMSKLLGIGISAPGPVDFKKGLILTPPELVLFHNFPAKDYLSAKTSLPVFLDNNSALLALREDMLRKAHFKNCLFVVTTSGIGSAILEDRKLHRGAGGYAGEIGHTVVVSDGEECPCGNKGCLERYIKGSDLKKRFGFQDYKKVIEDYSNGDEKAKEIVDFVSEKLSNALINAVNMLDLDSIVLYGELNDNRGILINRISEAINSRSIISAAHKINVSPSLQSEEGNILCSTAAILKAFYEQRI